MIKQTATLLYHKNFLSSQIEVDFILDNNNVAIEVKSSDRSSSKHLSGLKAFMEEYELKK